MFLGKNEDLVERPEGGRNTSKQRNIALGEEIVKDERTKKNNPGDDLKSVEIFYLKERDKATKGGKCIVCFESS